ncbi:hypothetical protein DSL72_001985 [Monilinia vaccinii-corymbosi]|uniref:Uncharacterized protein n=1 Tax=Monilinia vaccinii-corymbosi TaxID=61207 RepID=A0A8A3PBC6_9HELO|nr:hypothetical protein DSL72_001985 [Monilinia vaccinii-corymbosi]
MASQAPPSGPGRGISQLYPTASIHGMQSQASPAETPVHGASQLHAPSSSPRSPAPSAAPSPPHHPSIRPSKVATLRGPSYVPFARPPEAPHHPPTIKPSHAATLRAPSQAPSPRLSIRPSNAAALRGASQAPLSHTSSHSPIQHATVNQQAQHQPRIVLSPPSDTRTLLKRDNDTVNQRPSAHQTLLQRDQPPKTDPTSLQRDHSKIPSAAPAIRGASVAPITGPSKKFENAPSVRSILHSMHDIKMASRQATITQLHGPERQAQEEWALGKLGKLTTGCPQNYAWSRRGDGYICDGGSHYITDLLLTEGMGGLYVVKDKHDWENRTEGPYYWAGRNEQGKNLFMKVASPEMD